ncbi:MAG TPA: zf-HC2 domain-containing protein [Bryobacteraceae bacterium]|nr:zf-HC2 domain-containing protein [Bryobacteraceae bacterium]
MNCRDWEERLALYAGDDLAPAERAAVERHLGECAGCQVFLSGLKAGIDTLREAHEDGPSEAHLAAVRARVLADLRHRRRSRAWAWAVATVAAVLLLLVAVRPGRKEAPPVPVVAVSRPPAPVEIERPRPRQPVRRVRHVVARNRVRTPLLASPPPNEPAEPLVVKLITDDPDVVIYLISGGKGEPK